MDRLVRVNTRSRIWGLGLDLCVTCMAVTDTWRSLMCAVQAAQQRVQQEERETREHSV